MKIQVIQIDTDKMASLLDEVAAMADAVEGAHNTKENVHVLLAVMENMPNSFRVSLLQAACPEGMEPKDFIARMRTIATMPAPIQINRIDREITGASMYDGPECRVVIPVPEAIRQQFWDGMPDSVGAEESMVNAVERMTAIIEGIKDGTED